MNTTPDNLVRFADLDPSTWPLIPRRANKDRRPPRRYILTREGLNALRATAAQNRPWTRSTGPRTPEGRAAVRLNSLKHGNRTAEAVVRRARFTALRRASAEWLDASEQSLIASCCIVDLVRLLRVDETDLGTMTEADFAAAAEKVGVDIDDVSRWMNRCLNAKTLNGALRFAPPKPKKRPPAPPLKVEIVWADDATDIW